ncbi:endolytic transglycosylase MltG [Flavihumibacter rivuli]|uniref:endolytic transglycosylase MltG n=1 Tax=Flavihumibacter rivuli TaxID=2838156 RepID=UPI001BDE851C|nr:endolytic transglycosylase MltG [Flavihumibacter rivuli]ULQ57896.1 endolytic transglycosylase MltG [Flavihumibacter rivuli]
MKRLFLLFLLLFGLTAAIGGWLFLGPATGFSGNQYYLEVPTGSDYPTLFQKLKQDNIIRYPGLFDMLARQLDYPEKVRAGRYLIPKGASIITVLRKLRNGQQEPVNLVITKLRTKEDFASLAGKKFEFDSAGMMRFLNSPDSAARYGLDTNTIMTAVFPDTYTYFWNTTPSRVMAKILKARDAFWTDARKKQAANLGLTPEQVVIIASIVEEETNKNDEKGNVASVYLNRLKTGMKLGADPTVKFALRDFSLKRIYNKHLAVESPYNTYRVNGLPPGPICTPSRTTIDAVLQAPATPYLYFVAKPDFSGYHVFAETYTQHLANAKAYQEALDKLMKTKQGEDTGNQP